jgi:DNA-binding transcriptional ArsR family regulator
MDQFGAEARGGGDVFDAIAHPARRQILDLLREGEQPVNRLAAPFAMSRPAVSQHLRLLREAGLVSEHRVGRERRYRLQAEQLQAVEEWVRGYERFWLRKLDALSRFLVRDEARDE